MRNVDRSGEVEPAFDVLEKSSAQTCRLRNLEDFCFKPLADLRSAPRGWFVCDAEPTRNHHCRSLAVRVKAPKSSLAHRLVSPLH